MLDRARAPLGPQVGIPPSLEQVPVSRLQVDPTYQRATDSEASRRMIVGMVKQWNWTLCQPLVVARRTDGTLWVLDGQHRLAGAIERGDIPFVPAVISSSLDHKDEARTFVELNTRRQKLSQAQIFHGMLAAGDPDAHVVQAMLDATGWRVRKTSNTQIYKPGDLECAPMLVRMVASRGQAHPRFALTVLRAAYPETTVRQSATLIKAVVELFDEINDTSLTAQELVTAISTIPPARWIIRAAALQDQNRALSTIAAVSRAMLATAQGKSVPSADQSLKAVIVAQVAITQPKIKRRDPIVVSDQRVFGTTGKGWCKQCEQLRSREAAVACIALFCKLRAYA